MSDDEETAKEMMARSHAYFETIKQQHGPAAAQFSSELANIINLARLLALVHGINNDFTQQLGLIGARLAPAIQDSCKLTETQLRDIVSTFVELRMVNERPKDPSKLN